MKKKYDLRQNMKRLTKNLINLFLLTSNSVFALTPVFINEIHYDNVGTDTGEAIEIFGPANTDMTNWRIIRYNGNNQAVYTTPSAEPSGSDTLSGTIPDMGNGYGVIVVNYNGLQNGNPNADGIALVDNANTVIQFLSYEGSFTASDGAANGEMSTDIGVSENATTPVGHSLQLTGTGTDYEDFTWNTAIDNTFGRLNTGQALPSKPGDILINEIVTDPQQDWSTHHFTGKIGTNTISYVDEWVELYIATAGLNLTDWIIELNDGTDVSGDLTNSGAFQVSNYIAFNDGELTNTAEGDYLVLGNVKGGGAMNNDITIVLKDPTTTIIDQVQINGNATGVADEAVARLPNATDTNNNANDFNKIEATIGSTNNGCGRSATKIHTIQGNGGTSTEVGNIHTIEAIVVGDFQADNQLQGFFVQEEDTDVDGDSLTSEGIFVYHPNGTDVSVGNVVRVTGEVDEYFELTELKNISNVTICSNGAIVTPETINLPFADDSVLERFEGMSVNLPQTLTVSNNYKLGLYGQFTLSNGRLFNPTNVTEPGTAANALQAKNDLNRIIIDDGSTTTHPVSIITPSPQLRATNTLRNGNTVTGITGVLTYHFSEYRVHTTSTPTFTANPRLAAPASGGGTLKVASFNVLNYFNGNGDGSGFPTARGADTVSEFTRQRAKIISAIVAMGADIVGLMEMENDGYGTNSAIQDLVNGLNAAAPAGTTYAFITPDFALDSDAIKVALIYQVETVNPVNLPATTTNPPFNSRRPPLAQTFRENASTEQITVVVNHFKAKGSCPSDGSPNENQNDGQGCWNAERTQAANTLSNWLATDPTSGGDNIIIIGDLNAYAKEEPITAIKNAGYTDLVAKFIGANAYSYVYKGQAGYLDHALASASLTFKVTGVSEWHINADEPKAIDYNEESKSTEQLTNLYNADPYRASDHDPLILYFDLAIPNASIIITQTSGNTSITEGGATDSFDVVLNTQPTNEVTITVSPDSQTIVDQGTLTFTNSDWNTAQTVEITAVDDSTVENSHTSTIGLSASSVDVNYDSATFVVDGTEASSLSVNITDNDSAPPPASSPPRPKPTTRPLRIEMKGSVTGSVTSDPEGIDCREEDEAVCKYTFPMNTEITLTPQAGPNSEFDHWSGDRDCSGGQFVLKQSWVGMLCYAYFRRIETPVTPSTSTLGAYYIPGAENSGKTYVRITNITETPVEIKGTLYHQDGHLLGTAETVLFPQLAANATGVFNRASLAEQMGTTSWGQDIAWLDLTSPEDGLRVMNMYRNETKTLANMSLVAENALYNLPGSGETDEGFALIINTSDEPVSVTGTLYHAESGEVLGTPDAVLFDRLKAKAMGILSAPLLEQKVGTTSWQRAWLQITAPTDNLKLMNLNLNNGTVLNMSHVVEDALYNLPGTLVTKDSVQVRFTNTTDEAMQVKGILYHRDGQILGDADAVIIEELAPHATSELSMLDFEERFGSEPWTSRARLVITEPTEGLKLMELIRSKTGTVANASAVGKNRIFNVPPPSNFDKGWIRLINTTAEPIPEIRGTLYHRDGQILGTENSVLVENLAADSSVVLSQSMIAEAVETTPWTARAILEITAPATGVKLMGMIRSPSGALTNLSGALE